MTPSFVMPSDPGAPTRELRKYLDSLVARCRARQWFGFLIEVEVVQEISAEIQSQNAQVAREGYSAQQEDLEADKILTVVLTDRFLSPRDALAIRRAQVLIRKSAERDRRISDIAA